MKKIKTFKRLTLNIALSLALAGGLYSCSGCNNNNEDTGSEEVEEVIIEEEPAEQAAPAAAPEEAKDVEETKEVERAGALSGSSEAEGVDLGSDAPKGGLYFEEVYIMTDVDVPPMFKECAQIESPEERHACFEKSVMKYVRKNIKYPTLPKDMAVQGTSYVAFVIDKTGNISQTKLIKGAGAEYAKKDDAQENVLEAYGHLDRAAISAVQSLPTLTPAVKDGKPVSVQYIVPVKWQLNEQGSE